MEVMRVRDKGTSLMTWFEVGNASLPIPPPQKAAHLTAPAASRPSVLENREAKERGNKCDCENGQRAFVCSRPEANGEPEGGQVPTATYSVRNGDVSA